MGGSFLGILDLNDVHMIDVYMIDRLYDRFQNKEHRNSTTYVIKNNTFISIIDCMTVWV